MQKKEKILTISCVVLSLFLILNFCVIFYFMNLSTSKIFDKNILKVVEIKVSDDEITWGYATGCFINSNGTILTNKHVAYNSTTEKNYDIIQVRLANENEWLKANVLKISDNEDLALIKIERKNTHYFKFASKVANGENIYTIGNPNGFGLSFTKGVVSSNLRNVLYNEKTIEAIQTDFVINEGNSGGPVFNEDSELVGIISFRLKDKNNDVIQGVSFAIPINNIKNFINN